jgi:hypothetical protein
MEACLTVRGTHQLRLNHAPLVSSEESVSYLSTFFPWLKDSLSGWTRDICRGLAAVQINGTAKWGKSGPALAQSTS